MELIEKIKNLFKEAKESKSQSFIKETLPDSVEIFPLDARYFFTSRKKFKKYLKEDKTDFRKYQIDKYDCENYAFSLKAHMDYKHGLNTVGLVIDYESAHAYNVIVWPDKTFSIIEPQSDDIFPYENRDEKFYHFDGATILI